MQAQYALELSRNEQLLLEPEARKAEFLATLRQATVDRLRRLRRALLVASVSTTSALLIAYFFRATDVAPMLPRSVLAIGAIFSFASATVIYLSWRRKPRLGGAPAPASHPSLVHVLYWIGVCWAALAIF